MSKETSRDFQATKLIAFGDIAVNVTSFNGVMAVCADDEGCVLITKEQAMEFFNLVEAPQK